MQNNQTLIKLINFNDDITNSLKNENFNVSSNRLNGVIANPDEESRVVKAYNETPSDLHQMDYIVISNKPFLNDTKDHGNGFFGFVPPEGRTFVNLSAFDMYKLRSGIFETKNEQFIIFFAHKFEINHYTYYTSNNHDGHPDYLICDTLGFPEHPRTKNDYREGDIFKEPPEVNAFFSGITTLLKKYEEGSEFGTVYKIENRSSHALMLSKADEVIAKFQIENGKFFLYLPHVKRMGNFLVDLFTNVLPESNFDFFKKTLSEYGSMKWINNFEYISFDEKLKKIAINLEKENHLIRLGKLESELKAIEEDEENTWVKKLLTETGDSLVNSVVSFLKFIDFENITQPDDKSDEHPEKLLEEDINIASSPKFTYIIECKGIGGTSTDSNCQQASKVALRRKDAAAKEGVFDHTFQAFYIVNHQRYRAPEMRENPPFKSNQIEDARIASRGMISTYELFKVYHMVKSGVISKEDARECFKQHGLVDFRKKLKPLHCDEKFPSAKVYSFDLKKTPHTTINRSNRLVIEDNENHWHVFPIQGLQVNRNNVDIATSNDSSSAGVKVKNFIRNIKNFYIIN